MDNDLIQVVQLPIIEEQLQRLKDHWAQRALDAEAMVSTESAIQSIKAFRADMRKEFDEVETLRKKVKKEVMDPYEQFEAIYKDCVTIPFKKADQACAQKISDVEMELKRLCEEGLRDYFDELCAVHHLDWLTYERAGITVDMASAKAKTPKKLREQIAAFVFGVSESVNRIRSLENSSEIIVEYQKSLDASDAICAVQERHRRIAETEAVEVQWEAIRQREEEAVRKIEALAPPVAIEQPKIVKCTFTVRTTMDKLKKLKDFLIREGIQYE